MLFSKESSDQYHDIHTRKHGSNNREGFYQCAWKGYEIVPVSNTFNNRLYEEDEIFDKFWFNNWKNREKKRQNCETNRNNFCKKFGNIANHSDMSGTGVYSY